LQFYFTAIFYCLFKAELSTTVQILRTNCNYSRINFLPKENLLHRKHIYWTRSGIISKEANCFIFLSTVILP